MHSNASALADGIRQQLASGLTALQLDADLLDPLSTYLALLIRWNKTYNLTAIRDPAEMVSKHILDSLSMQAHVAHLSTLADLGSGAGLPGIPLAIVHPHLSVTLIESNGKKARFLREAVRTLQLPNVQVSQSRAESTASAQTFDGITARALATLPVLIEWGEHLLTPSGKLYAMKGVYPSEEIADLPAPWQLEQAIPLHIPGLSAERHLVIVGRSSQQKA